MDSSSHSIWRASQALVWLVGLVILLALWLWPPIGIHAFWNVLIPVAPALLVFGTGIWRNICPMSGNALLLRHLGRSKREALSPTKQLALQWIGLLLLLAIVPLRHVILDTNGPATAWVIGGLTLLAIWAGNRWEWKSGWCSSLCPVHPVEKLYGVDNIGTVPNMHCTACEKCVDPCPDSTEGFHLQHPDLDAGRRQLGTLMAGGFPGFIWGWFQVQDYSDGTGWNHLLEAYAWPLLGMVASLGVFCILRSACSARMDPERGPERLTRFFGALGVSCYYWYRLPMLFGFGPFPGDGMLVDLRSDLPEWFPLASQACTTTLFFWWMVLRKRNTKSWSQRPAYADPGMVDFSQF